jgi:hypothetical protein
MRHSHHRHPILTLSVSSYISYSSTVATTTPSPGCPSSISSHLASLGSRTCPAAHNHNQTASPPLLSSSPLRNYNQQYSFHSPSPAASPLHHRHRQPVIHLIIIHLQERARAFIPSVLLSTLPSPVLPHSPPFALPVPFSSSALNHEREASLALTLSAPSKPSSSRSPKRPLLSSRPFYVVSPYCRYLLFLLPFHFPPLSLAIPPSSTLPLSLPLTTTATTK